MLKPSKVELFDPLFTGGFADRMVRLCEKLGTYGMYGREPIQEGLGKGLAQRHDAAVNFVNTGGRFGRKEPREKLAARTNYFRETYAYDREVRVPGIEAFTYHEGFIETSKKLHDATVIQPSIVYANILTPGQELAVHTDVPEFRGANRTKDPEWLLVVMHHSRLFDHWRMKIATGIAYFHHCRGGELAYYPEGAEGAPRTLEVKHNTAALLDTDSTFHGVDRVEEDGRPFPPFRPGMQLRFEGNDSWAAGWPDQEPLARYKWGEIRFSVSWKAYCYADERERRTVEEHTDDLDRGMIMDRLLAELRRRDRIGAGPPDEELLPLTLIDEYIHFPPPQPEPH